MVGSIYKPLRITRSKWPGDWCGVAASIQTALSHQTFSIKTLILLVKSKTLLWLSR